MHKKPIIGSIEFLGNRSYFNDLFKKLKMKMKMKMKMMMKTMMMIIN